MFTPIGRIDHARAGQAEAIVKRVSSAIPLHCRRWSSIPRSAARADQDQTTRPAAATCQPHLLLLRLSTHRQDVLRFLADPRVPFTNNLAERDGRMMKLRQKISGGFRSEDCTKDFALIRSFLSTARKQGWHFIDTLTADPCRLLSQLRAG